MRHFTWRIENLPRPKSSIHNAPTNGKLYIKYLEQANAAEERVRDLRNVALELEQDLELRMSEIEKLMSLPKAA